MVNKRETNCPADTIRFDDYSMLAHGGATWAWEFPGGTPATSGLRNPKVVYTQPGVYDVSLTVTNPSGTSTKTVPAMVTVHDAVVNSVPPAIDFSNTDHFTINNPDNGITWSPISLEECDPEGDVAYMVDNYNYSSYGQDEIVLPLNMDLTQAIDPKLTFRVAYAPYYDGNAFIDSLKVLLTYNCGETFIELFSSGGEALSTTTSGLGPNDLYEYEVFRPGNCEEWRHVSIDLNAYVGQYVTIKFLNKSGYGNQLYIDDIFLETENVGLVDVQPGSPIGIDPNPTTGPFTVSGTAPTKPIRTISITNPLGQIMFTRKTSGQVSLPIKLTLADSAPGLYYVNVVFQDGTVTSEKVVKE
jgi:PKD repeat protein